MKTVKLYARGLDDDRVIINDDPITDNFDLWRTIDAAQMQMRDMIAKTNTTKGNRIVQLRVCNAVFDNLKTLVMDYVYREKRSEE